MTAVGYTHYGNLHLWHRQKGRVTVDFHVSQVSDPVEESRTDKATGKRFSEDSQIGCFVTAFMNYDVGLLPEAIDRLGRLAPGGIYGFVPALQTSALQLTRWRPPEPPMYPCGRSAVVRPIGRRT
jgi:hypothetical protein